MAMASSAGYAEAFHESVRFPLFGSANVFELWWPVVRNVQVWQGGTNRTNATFFIDDTKPPLSKKA